MITRLSFWWAVITSPVNRRLLVATALEFTGIGLVLYALYMLHPLAFIIGLGGMCLLLAQGLTRRDET